MAVGAVNKKLWRTPMKKTLLSIAATLIMVAAFANDADAQGRRGGGGGPGISRGGGGGFVAMRGGGGGQRFVGGHRIGGHRFVGGHRFIGHRRFVRHRHFFVGHRFAHRRFFRHHVAFVGGGCWRYRLVPTPIGLRWRLVNVCYPLAYGYGRYAYGYGSYGY